MATISLTVHDIQSTSVWVQFTNHAENPTPKNVQAVFQEICRRAGFKNIPKIELPKKITPQHHIQIKTRDAEADRFRTIMSNRRMLFT